MKFKRILVILAITLLLTGCSSVKPAHDTVVASTPEEAISGMFTALRTVDSSTLNSLVQYKRIKKNGVIFETERFFGGSLDDESKKYLQAIFESLNYSILSSQQTAEQMVMTVEITNKDLSEVDFLSDLDSDSPLLVQSEAIKEITETITRTIDVEVVKSEAGWQVMIDDGLRDALWGGKQGILDALSSWLPQ